MNKHLFVFQVFATLACAGFTAYNVHHNAVLAAAITSALTVINAYQAHKTFAARS